MGVQLLRILLITDCGKRNGTTGGIGAVHNPPGILGIKACQEKIPGVPMVAVFDTAFHQTMPPASYLYGLPYEYYEKLQVRRYGFHGTSHRFVSIRAGSCSVIQNTARLSPAI